MLRDVYVGLTRFEQIRADLGISRKVLTERLNHLVGHGVLERQPYDRRRFEYVLTEKGAELVDLLMVMVGWGDKWLAGTAGPPVLYRHHACGHSLTKSRLAAKSQHGNRKRNPAAERVCPRR